MAKKKTNRQQDEPDSVFFLKIVVFFLLGTIWVRLVGSDTSEFSIPVGLVFGILLARHEHFMIDRKIEYVVLFVSTIISFYLPIGLVV